jgi:tRNA-modifying protein YgfZ
MSNEWNLIELDDLGVLRLRGADGVRFLQGQVSSDVEQLTPERSQIAGYHNPQGRAIAVLRLVQLAPDDWLAILPRELAATVASRLGKFILRAKVKIAAESAGWRVAGLVAPHVVGAHGAGAATNNETAAAFEARATNWAAAQLEQATAQVVAAGEQGFAAAQLEMADSVVELPTASALMLPDAVNAQSRSEGAVIVRVGFEPARWLVISPVGEAAPVSGCAVGERAAWRLLDIADGIPQVYAATSEEFVAQMLNLDAQGGISFQKGCYTGQEVIARAHYRGRVKRRLQRFLSREPAKLAVGQSGQLADGRAFKVVEVAELANGRCEFLAVAPLAAGASRGADDEAPAGGAKAQAAGATATTSATIDAEQLPLPYPLPE